MSDRCIETDVGQRIAAYELGLLDAIERRAFEAHVAACESCRDDLAATADVATILTGDPRGVASALRRAESADSLRRALRRWLGVPRVLVPALGAAAALAWFFVLRQPSPASLARIEPLPYVPLISRDAHEEDAASVYSRAMERYAQRDWDGAAGLLEQALAATPPLPPGKRDQAQVYHGICLLLEQRPEAAVEPLERATESSLPVVADRARWYLAQASLTLGQTARAETLLASLAASPGYAAEAEEQLRRLRAFER